MSERAESVSVLLCAICQALEVEVRRHRGHEFTYCRRCGSTHELASQSN